ncbi:hypothetical protein SVAN01_00463 [Stagonosporopsis vannaccii]|nr:hypothetical protein SVAN01_00463 [Stagonosporopsis vannaccii]
MHLATPSISILTFIFLSTSRIISAATTIGPLAPISIYKLPNYSSARPCAAGCLVYNGIWVCGVNGGYHDLGKDLGCGCAPNNACFCSAGLASSASSYISSCVSATCSSIGNVEGDVASMLSMYDGYCQTANVETSTSVPATTTTEDDLGRTETGEATTATSANSLLAATSASATSTPTHGAAGAEQEEDTGLSKSDIIALATGLGIGIPSLIVGAVALYMQLRRKPPKSPATSTNDTASRVGSQIQMLHLDQPQPQKVPVHEVGNERSQR